MSTLINENIPCDFCTYKDDCLIDKQLELGSCRIEPLGVLNDVSPERRRKEREWFYSEERKNQIDSVLREINEYKVKQKIR